ncbi:carbohydrate ABC transporter permease [Cohnella lubricantis]|uniref:Carbohydrate ABC transporter permease n=1 Tax=Cohnella lubricantis TaxID=2163172 RepID=A0A841TA81_9BACL|nr:carbohydrate ABC transporter permease [Cohnella lubricantis]MBB6678403.1 carbohydrate ABC transporter permease [Cohnella lubricantis]MBP2116783.1 putative aldouronate transport system permease protein [Cohnella lubricantis]
MNLMTRGERVFQVFLVLFITLMCAAMLYPFVHLLSVSLSTPAEAIRPGPHLYPLEFSLEAYRKTFEYGLIWIGYRNTLIRAAGGTFIALFMIALTAYPLSKRYLPHRSFYTLFIVFTMFFSGGLIPTYMLIKNIGLMDSMWVYILPVMIPTFSLLIMRNFFMEIPDELEDSAKIDGAGDFRSFVSIVLPLSKPILATVGLWQVVNHWNAWFDAMLYIQDPGKIVLQMFLRKLIVSNEAQELNAMMNQAPGVEIVTPETIKAAALMVSTLPILVVYPFIQKYFVKGILVGSLKG